MMTVRHSAIGKFVRRHQFTSKIHCSQKLVLIVAGLSMVASPTQGQSMRVDPDGNVGIGTTSPTASLHVQRDDGTAAVLVEETASPARRNMFVLRNNGEVTFDLKRSDTDANWQFLNNEFFVINRNDRGSGTEFYLDEAGNGTFEGEVFTSGTCVSGCDIVFDPTYDLESIEEHAEYMWKHSHLKGVGPTPEKGSINLSRKTVGLLNELEKAHIYIEQLHSESTEIEVEVAELKVRNNDLQRHINGLKARNSELQQRLATMGAELTDRVAKLEVMLVGNVRQ